MLSYLLLALLAVTIAAYFAGYSKARAFATGAGDGSQHSLSGYHGAYVAAWAGIPSFLLVLSLVALPRSGRRLALGVEPAA